MDHLLNSYILWIVHTYLYVVYLLLEPREKSLKFLSQSQIASVVT